MQRLRSKITLSTAKHARSSISSSSKTRYSFSTSNCRPQRWSLAAKTGAGSLTLLALVGLQASSGDANTSSISDNLKGSKEQRSTPRSPIEPLHLASATRKLSEGEGTHTFDIPGRQARCDTVRLASNNPVEDDYSYAEAAGPAGETWKFWGVYDGHAGWATSAVLRETLIMFVSERISTLKTSMGLDAVQSTIRQAFVDFDNTLFDEAEAAISSTSQAGAPECLAKLAPVVAGSCALLSMYDPSSSMLHVACVGDSRAVIGRYDASSDTYSAEPMSQDQTGKNAAEYARIEAAHPGEIDDILNKENGRLLGIAVTRAFGDHRWKWSSELIKRAQDLYFGPAARPKYLTPPYMTAEPVVESTKVNAGGKGDFLVMASDGLWDHISSEHAVEAVSRWIAERPGTPTSASRRQVKTSSESYTIKDGFAEWKVAPEDFVVEDANAATHLVKNAFGGARRDLFLTVMTSYPPVSRHVRDDVTVHVIFFGDV